MFDSISWNLSSERNRYRDVDAITISLGKSGRTWLRVLLHKALSIHFQIPFDLEKLEDGAPSLPILGYSHELASHVRDDSWAQRLVGKSILPRSLTDRKRLIMLSRDPRDVVVSSWFHKTHRSKKTDCGLEEFIRHPRWGIAALVWIMNRWRTRFATHPSAYWLAYEDLHAAPHDQLDRLLTFLSVEVDSEMLAEAVEFASFDRMKSAEERGEYVSERLQPGRPDDPDSFKVRRGKVRGYLDYLDAGELEFLDEHVATLNPFYGYVVSGQSRA